MTRRIAIYGAGGFGREIAPLAADADIVFVSDLGDEQRLRINGHAVIAFETLGAPSHCDREVILAVGSSAQRQALAEKCTSAGLTFGQVSAPTARILHDVELGEGAVICDYAVLTSNVRTGKHFQMNLFAYVAHDCVIGDYVTLAPRVSCNGRVVIEDGAYIGTGACLRQGSAGRPLRIGAGAVVGMGAVVTRDIPPGETWVGIPARRQS